MSQDTVPGSSTAGVTQLHPAGEESETKVVPGGSVSSSDTEAAALGPALVTVMVYVRFVPAVTGSGESTLVTESGATEATVVAALGQVGGGRLLNVRGG